MALFNFNFGCAQQYILSPSQPPPNLLLSAIDCSTQDTPLLPFAKRKRKSAPKSKSGCITCKERRVKCGEERPGCKRCKKTGRKCGGYPDPPVKSSRPRRRRNLKTRPISPALSDTVTSDTSSSFTLSPALSDAVDHADLNELYFLDYFRLNAAVTLSGPFDAEFWTNILSAACHKEPCVRYSLVALSSMHRHYISASEQGESPPICLAKPEMTLHYYNKAINALGCCMAKDDCSVTTTLMCCVLFITLEIIQGDSTCMIAHVRNGQNLISSWRERRAQKTLESGHSVSDYNEDCLVEQHVMPFIGQADSLANCFSYRDMSSANHIPEDKDHYKFTEDVPAVFASLHEARNCLVTLTERTTALTRFSRGTKYEGDPSFADVANIYRVQGQLRAWKTSFEDVRYSLQSTLEVDPSQASISSLLLIRYHVLYIWSATALTPEQIAYDEWFASFQAIVDLAPLIIDGAKDLSPQPSGFGSHVSGADVVPQLVFTAMLCRDSQIRRQAIHLLKRCVQSVPALTTAVPSLISTAERWTSIEEAAVPALTTSPHPLDMGSPASVNTPPIEGQVVDPMLLGMHGSAPRLPPEHARIHFSRTLDTTAESDGAKRKAEFWSKPSGVYDQWYVQTEGIEV